MRSSPPAETSAARRRILRTRAEAKQERSAPAATQARERMAGTAGTLVVRVKAEPVATTAAVTVRAEGAVATRPEEAAQGRAE